VAGCPPGVARAAPRVRLCAFGCFTSVTPAGRRCDTRAGALASRPRPCMYRPLTRGQPRLRRPGRCRPHWRAAATDRWSPWLAVAGFAALRELAHPGGLSGRAVWQGAPGRAARQAGSGSQLSGYDPASRDGWMARRRPQATRPDGNPLRLPCARGGRRPLPSAIRDCPCGALTRELRQQCDVALTTKFRHRCRAAPPGAGRGAGWRAISGQVARGMPRYRRAVPRPDLTRPAFLPNVSSCPATERNAERQTGRGQASKSPEGKTRTGQSLTGVCWREIQQPPCRFYW
jgi:hypothetical protein